MMSIGFYKKWIWMIVLFGFHLSAAFSQSNSQFPKDTIIWRADYLLKPSDFKGKPVDHIPAATYSGISLYQKEDEGTLKFYVEALFLKSKSFMKDTSEYILKHEQLHFDISELFARKLRQKISQVDFRKVNNVQKEIESLYHDYVMQLNSEQELYDKNTEHGENPARQQVWIEEVKQDLEALDAFKSAGVNVVRN